MSVVDYAGKGNTSMKTILSFTAILTLSSCMHLGMVGGHDSREETVKPAERVEKEVVSGDLRVVVAIPPLEERRESVVTLRLTGSSDNQPVSGAEVLLTMNYRHEGEPESHHPPSRLSHDIYFDQLIAESEPGLFEIRFEPSSVGAHSFTFAVTAEQNKASGPLIVEAVAFASTQNDHHGSDGMHAGTNLSTLAIIGGAAMGAMMIVVWASRGSMF